MCCRQRSGQIDRATGILDDNRREAATPRVLRRETHTEIECKTSEENARDAPLAQMAAKPGRCPVDLRYILAHSRI